MRKLFKKKAPPAPTPEQVLKELGCAYERLPDGSLYVPGTIDLTRRELERLPDLSEVRVGGSFQCQYNRLTTLAGAPRIILGGFLCHMNKLTSLEGGPQFVGGDFACSYNKLETLQGAPRKIGGNFQCDRKTPSKLSKMVLSGSAASFSACEVTLKRSKGLR